ncbi:MAG: motility associated factor glycosyltransferase family protein [Brevinematia bacterium]
MIDFEKLDSLSKENKLIETTKNGLYTLKINQTYIHSIYDPYREAERILKPLEELSPGENLIIFFGAGIGYHIELLEKRGFRNVIIIELNRDVLKIFKKVYRLPEGYFLISPDDKPEKLDSIFSLFEIQKFKRIKTIQFRATYDRDLYKSYEDRIQRLLEVKLGDFTTRMKFEEIWFINMLKNISFLNSSVEVAKLFSLARNLPVILISAGPSLKETLKYLKEIEGYAIFIAVDTAILPLYEADIKVDFVYSLDSQVHNLSDFLMVSKNYISRTNLIYDIVSNPALIAYFSNIRKNGSYNFISTTAHLDFDYNNNPFFVKSEFVNWIEAKGGIRLGDIETGGSVSTSAFHFAYLLGGNPIILTGQDLAFSFNVSHSPSSSHFYRLLNRTHRLNTVETLFFSIIQSRKLLEEFSIDGKKITSDFVLHNFKGWFEESAKNIKNFQKNISLINASLYGVKIENFETIAFDNLISKLKKEYKKIDKNLFFSFSLIENYKVDKIIDGIIKLKDFLCNLPVDENLFLNIEKSEFYFLRRYFMRERILYERYEKLDKETLRRKIHRITKNIEGLYARKAD